MQRSTLHAPRKAAEQPNRQGGKEALSAEHRPQAGFQFRSRHRRAIVIAVGIERRLPLARLLDQSWRQRSVVSSSEQRARRVREPAIDDSTLRINMRDSGWDETNRGNHGMLVHMLVCWFVGLMHPVQSCRVCILGSPVGPKGWFLPRSEWRKSCWRNSITSESYQRARPPHAEAPRVDFSYLSGLHFSSTAMSADTMVSWSKHSARAVSEGAWPIVLRSPTILWNEALPWGIKQVGRAQRQ